MTTNFTRIIIIFLIFFTFSSFLNADSSIVQKDKIMHLLSNTFVTYWSCSFSDNIIKGRNNGKIIFNISLPLTLSFGKELSDKHLKKTEFSWQDMAFNTVGIVVGFVLYNNLR